jgi:hypothetical protein
MALDAFIVLATREVSDGAFDASRVCCASGLKRR